MLRDRLHIFLSLTLAAALGFSAGIPELDACAQNCINQAVANSTCSSLFVFLVP
jgi:hypothetical protein